MKKRKLVTTLFTLVCVGILANESVSFAESGEQTERTLDTEEAYESESEETEEESQGSLGEDSQSAELSDSQSLAGTKELYSLKSNEWLEQSGTHRGKHHDKQDIGLILKKGSRIRVRQTNKNFNEQVTMELLADGKKSEQSVTIDSSWQTVKTEDDVAVFFETPTDKKKATIEYTVEGETLPLPTYEHGSDEGAFFSDWDKTEANVALIKSAKMQMLVPITAKEAVRNLKDFSSIEDLINHSDEVLSFADENLGLDNSTEYNQTTENKYFIKEDKDTTADGYYGNQYTVANERTFEDFWLRSSSWEQNAEIINGYQPNYTSIGTPTADSSNQLYNIRYLKKYEGIAAVEDSYLFTNGNKEQTDNELATQLNAGVHYSDLSTESHSALLLLAMVDQKAGEDALKNLNQSHRSSYFDHTYERINLQDRLIQSYGNTAQLDFGPAIQRWNVPIDKELAKETRMNYRPVAHLDHVVPQDRQAEVMAQFNEKELLSSRFQVVDNDDIAFLGLKGQATLHFSDELLKKLKGKTVSLKDGDKVVASETVSENTVVFNDIPNGVYTIDSSVDLADCDTNYVYVKENENEVTISGEQIDTFDLLGLSDSSSGELIVDTGEQKCLTFRKNTSAPHNYFKNEKYYSVSVYRDKKEIYSKIVNGNDESAFSDTVDLQKEDVIAINHAESKKRLLTTDDSLIDENETTNCLQVQENGLKQIDSESTEEFEVGETSKSVGSSCSGSSNGTCNGNGGGNTGEETEDGGSTGNTGGTCNGNGSGNTGEETEDGGSTGNTGGTCNGNGGGNTGEETEDGDSTGNTGGTCNGNGGGNTGGGTEGGDNTGNTGGICNGNGSGNTGGGTEGGGNTGNTGGTCNGNGSGNTGGGTEGGGNTGNTGGTCNGNGGGNTGEETEDGGNTGNTGGTCNGNGSGNTGGGTEGGGNTGNTGGTCNGNGGGNTGEGTEDSGSTGTGGTCNGNGSGNTGEEAEDGGSTGDSGSADSVDGEMNLSANQNNGNNGSSIENIKDYTIDIYTDRTNLLVNEEQQLIGIIDPEPETTPAFEWCSSNPEVATVSEDGLVTAESKGEATITVRDMDTGEEASVDMTVGRNGLPSTGSKANPILKLVGYMTLLATGVVFWMKKTGKKLNK